MFSSLCRWSYPHTLRSSQEDGRYVETQRHSSQNFRNITYKIKNITATTASGRFIPGFRRETRSETAPSTATTRSNRNRRRDRRRLFICSVRSSVVRYWAGTSRQRWNVSDPEDITGSLVDRGGRFHRQRPPDPPSGSIASLEPQPDGFEGRSVVACPSVDLHSECATRRSADSESERPRPRVD